MNNIYLRFKRLEKRGMLAPVAGLPCPLCKIDFSACKHSISEVEDAIRWWRDYIKYSKMFGI